MTLKDAYNKAIFLLQKEHIKNPSLEARLIISYILKIDQKQFILKIEKDKINFYQWFLVRLKIRKRLTGISMAYIIHRKYFYDSELYINRSVLIPRPETELLIEIILKNVDKKRFYYILEIGTGSGNISIELAKKIENCRIESIDKSFFALIVAKKNIVGNNISARKIKLEKKNIFKFRSDKKYDIIVSNPPYIETKQVEYLKNKRIVSDPFESLNGGKTGLDFYHTLKYLALENLSENGFMIFEHGFDQKENILKIFDDEKFSCNCFKDLNNLDRAIVIRHLKKNIL